MHYAAQRTVGWNTRSAIATVYLFQSPVASRGLGQVYRNRRVAFSSEAQTPDARRDEPDEGSTSLEHVSEFLNRVA